MEQAFEWKVVMFWSIPSQLHTYIFRRRVAIERKGISVRQRKKGEKLFVVSYKWFCPTFDYITAGKTSRAESVCSAFYNQPHIVNSMLGLRTRKSLVAFVDHVITTNRQPFCTEVAVLKPISASIRVNQSNIDNIKKVCCRKGRSCTALLLQLYLPTPSDQLSSIHCHHRMFEMCRYSFFSW